MVTARHRWQTHDSVLKAEADAWQVRRRNREAAKTLRILTSKPDDSSITQGSDLRKIDADHFLKYSQHRLAGGSVGGASAELALDRTVPKLKQDGSELAEDGGPRAYPNMKNSLGAVCCPCSKPNPVQSNSLRSAGTLQIGGASSSRQYPLRGGQVCVLDSRLCASAIGKLLVESEPVPPTSNLALDDKSRHVGAHSDRLHDTWPREDVEACHSSLSWTPRPGVNQSIVQRSASLIQAAWRNLQHSAILAKAKNCLNTDGVAAGFKKSCHAALGSSEAEVGVVSNSVSGENELAAPSTKALDIFEIDLGGKAEQQPPCLRLYATFQVWDEAITYRQPCVGQLMQAHRRWLMQVADDESEAQLRAMSSDPAEDVIQDMSKTERRLQLRVRIPEVSSWRPPCAFGTRPHEILESSLAKWRKRLLSIEVEGSAYANEERTLDASFRPCTVLFDLILASSCMHRRDLAGARSWLTSADKAIESSVDGSYLRVVGPQVRARISLCAGRLAILEAAPADASTHARKALALFQSREGPRDFWPTHCWELGGCHWLLSLASVQQGRLRDVLPRLKEAKSFFSSGPAGGDKLAVSHRLAEDLSALEMEASLAALVEPESGPWTENDIGAEWRRLKREADAFLLNVVQPHVKAILIVVLTKLALIQEMPWFLAGSSRPETLDALIQNLSVARRCLGVCDNTGSRMLDEVRDTYTCKVFPVEVACRMMKGNYSAFPESMFAAEAWARASHHFYGPKSQLYQCSAELSRAAVAAHSNAEKHSSAKPGMPSKVLQRAVRNALAINCVGWLAPFL